ncbi:MAG: M23 family metallopeptidase [Caulobacteraceae bacterium]|nr:M23 family metallopeptidase [Caulobacteraceae bacterium]
MLGRTTPRAELVLDGANVGQASREGLFVIGFDRDSGPAASLSITTPDGRAGRSLAIAPGRFDVQRIDGLPMDQVAPGDPALLARIAAEAQRKAAGFASCVDADDFSAGFVLPVEGARLTARFGGQRILDGVPERPHYGSDLAAPVGTPVRAPAPGLVCFAESGLHFDGALVLIDHGQGLISAYLHLSRIDAVPGRRVEQGETIGAVGMEGRATGPHLCWRMKWRGRNLDPMLMVGAEAPA